MITLSSAELVAPALLDAVEIGRAGASSAARVVVDGLIEEARTNGERESSLASGRSGTVGERSGAGRKITKTMRTERMTRTPFAAIQSERQIELRP